MTVILGVFSLSACDNLEKEVKLTPKEKFELLQSIEEETAPLSTKMSFNFEYLSKINNQENSIKTNLKLFLELDESNSLIIHSIGNFSFAEDQEKFSGNIMLYVKDFKAYLNLKINGTGKYEYLTLEQKEVMDISRYLEQININNSAILLQLINLITTIKKEIPEELLINYQEAKYDELEENTKKILDAILNLVKVTESKNGKTLSIKISKTTLKPLIEVIYEVRGMTFDEEEYQEELEMFDDKSEIEFKLQLKNNKIVSSELKVNVPLMIDNINYTIKSTFKFNSGVSRPQLPSENELSNYQEVEKFTIISILD